MWRENEILLFVLMTMFGALGGLFLKKLSLYTIGINKPFLMHFFLAGFLYALGAFLNIILLKFIPYTVVYPLTAFTYIWTLIFSRIFLKETISVTKIGGVLLIICGAFVLIL
ncbi:EamA family transporter [Paenibacillus sp. F4]|uniref:EamA family transporter n=1 Tax=Paenibacillus sp. F4 TaxID=357385 RepID=UPI0021556AB5|nr:EamA family transporter [Paenibacillus sp. F4]